eukprot:TRINITY_DN7138_c0_g3_i1.p1 TRINITY_DN7138_c0_g3~~TRINITY_DN7138_c0_g3_i1.p1  ORF type:complete len:316 (+),score=76.17 TRINITY_DN7138_c0_g3_i1:58-948(+)
MQGNENQEVNSAPQNLNHIANSGDNRDLDDFLVRVVPLYDSVSSKNKDRNDSADCNLQILAEACQLSSDSDERLKRMREEEIDDNLDTKPASNSNPVSVSEKSKQQQQQSQQNQNQFFNHHQQYQNQEIYQPILGLTNSVAIPVNVVPVVKEIKNPPVQFPQKNSKIPKTPKNYKKQKNYCVSVGGPHGREYPSEWLCREGDLKTGEYDPELYNGQEMEVERILDEFVYEGGTKFWVKFVGFEAFMGDMLDANQLEDAQVFLEEWKKTGKQELKLFQKNIKKPKNSKRRKTSNVKT